MRIAITGGTGFIGKPLVERHLAMGDTVHVLTRREQDGLPEHRHLTTLHGDLTSSCLLSSFLDNTDVLYHCASELTNKAVMQRLHVNGTRRLIEVAKGRVTHWVQLSSVGVYGPVREGTITESSELNPTSEYESTKAESDRLVADASNGGSFSCCVLRPSIVYGKDMPNQSLRSWIRMIQRKLFFFVGKQGATTNFVHVNDVVEAMATCARTPSTEIQIYNLSETYPIEEFVGTISKVLGISCTRKRIPHFLAYAAATAFEPVPFAPLTRTRVRALSNRATYSSDKIKSQLGFRFQVTLEEGVRELVDTLK